MDLGGVKDFFIKSGFTLGIVKGIAALAGPLSSVPFGRPVRPCWCRPVPFLIERHQIIRKI
jgi:hypothetical protein